ncbi:hypothetical protein K1719_040307 [Acacia pycnantha]|nr:hypothetical protein K1719_040307 [Acacia pycnantha]
MQLVFPKEVQQQYSNKTIDEDGYPTYRRRDDGRTVELSGVPLDNRYVVPYNPLLLHMFQVHINVEKRNQSTAIKYLFKYISKENDRVVLGIFDTSEDRNRNKVINEIQQYYNCRYVSSCEASWRIFGFEIYHGNPAVERLRFEIPLQDKEQAALREIDGLLRQNGKSLHDFNYLPMPDDMPAIVLTVVSSGTAATLLPCGMTAHSSFAILIQITESSVCPIWQNSPLANLIKTTRLIIWDEAPLVQHVDDGNLGDSIDGVADIEIQEEVLIPNSNDRAILAPTIEMANKINEYMCAMLPGLPPHRLVLKVGSPIILLRNIDQANGLCNGTSLCVSMIGKKVIEVITLNGSRPNRKVLIHRMDMNPS